MRMPGTGPRLRGGGAMETTQMQELTVNDLLADPVTRLVMQRDGVTDEQVHGLMRRAALARQAGTPVAGSRAGSVLTRNSRG